MKLWNALLAAFSTYSAIPTPRFEWDESAAGYALCFFPAVGAVNGLALWLWYALCRTLDAGGALFAALAVCLPLLITGGIHMDGYMDTVDAISSHQSRERKLEIMKDSTCGAFAVIYCGVYLLLSFGLLHELYRRALVPALCPGYVLSRALSALCAALLPSARSGGMLYAYTERAKKRALLGSAAVTAAVAAAAMLWPAPLPGLCGAAAAGLWALGYRSLALRLFGGVTGDTAGFFLQLSELAIPLGTWIGSILR